MNALHHIRDDIAALPLWQGKPNFEPLPGGISNLSFVATDRVEKYVVRLTRDFPFHNVYRDREVAVARAAHAAGFAPEVVHAEPGLMISRYLDAQPLTPDDVRANIERIVELLLRFHTRMSAPIGDYAFDVAEINRGYLRELEPQLSRHDFTAWSAANEIGANFRGAAVPVFAHHDLLPGNILDDGRRLWLIDFEYSGPGDAMFDLANLSSSASFTRAESAALLHAYFGSTELIEQHRLTEMLSLLREGLWSLVSAQHIHERDFDYRAYAETNFARVRELIRD